ncbi:metal ion binding [Ascochyta rabiei]|uniref:Metal ion binding n=2 Tax=Didymella rabiei TaxID=5454 RepID=A0A163CPY2_DIDRA|nr:metal ion binding [Ascochyta rabiei]
MQHSKWAQADHHPSLHPSHPFHRPSRFGAPLQRPLPSGLDYGTDMTVCKFYSQGNCRFGDNCKFEHPGSQRDGNRSSGGGFSARSNNNSNNNNNRFGAFGGGDNYRPNQNSGGAFGSARDIKTLPYHLDIADIRADLSGQRPIYPLSCYGPGRDAPRQLIEGLVEISPEELRVRYYTQRATGNENVAQQEESELHAKMQQQVKAIADDIEGAVRYIEEGANVHPNRLDMVRGNTTPAGQPGSSSSPFAQASGNAFSSAPSTQASAFGQASTPGFGRPAFGQASNPAQTTSQTSSAFAAPSALGQKPSPFGQPTAIGGGGAFGKPAFGGSGFGQASIPGSGSAFGQPSGLGQQPAFGQTSAPSSTPAFGQASAPSGTPAFGQASNPAQGSAFGQANALGQTRQSSGFGKPAFGQSPFGQTAQAGSGTSPFGQQPQTSNPPFGQQPAQGPQSSPFSQAAQSGQQPNPFGQAQPQQPANQPNPFGGVAAAPSAPAFGQPSAPAFGAPSLGGQQAQASNTQAQNPFGQAAGQAAAQSAAAPATAPSPFSTQNQAAPAAVQTPAQPAAAGGPIDPKERYKEGSPEAYEGEAGKLLEEIYRRVGQMGRFNDDEDIPLTPPKCEWIVPVAI